LSSNRLDKIAPGKNRLVLYPLAPRYRIPSPGHFAGFLVQSGFVAGLPVGKSFQGLQPGENFMRHLTFVGCSPSVASDENLATYNNYSIDLIATNDNLTIIAGDRVKSPMCPICGRRAEGKLAADGIRILENQVIWICPECEANTPVENINWRNKLAVATHYIEVKGVFEGEVIPADKFLKALAEQTGIGWSYCYC
jgi:hypothetical protein